jgi:hypothetical protein
MLAHGVRAAQVPTAPRRTTVGQVLRVCPANSVTDARDGGERAASCCRRIAEAQLLAAWEAQQRVRMQMATSGRTRRERAGGEGGALTGAA